jgi:hypothetical protein
MIKFGLKTLKLIMMIMNFTYVIGMLYYVVSIFYADFIIGIDLKNFDCPKDNRKFDFIHCRWDYEKRSTSYIQIAMTYFAFTTLATIGFGDIHPRADIERIYGIFVFLFGVAVFTVILASFTNIIDEFRKFTSDEHLDGNLQ